MKIWYYIDSMFLGLVSLERDYTHQETIECKQFAEFVDATQL